jgi:hypothetical protein
MLASFEYQLGKDEYVVGLRLTTLSLASQDRWRSVRCLAPVVIAVLAAAFANYSSRILQRDCPCAHPDLVWVSVCADEFDTAVARTGFRSSNRQSFRQLQR